MNFYYHECQKRFPKHFKGKVSILGHSLGSVISYEILVNQCPDKFTENDQNLLDKNNIADDDTDSIKSVWSETDEVMLDFPVQKLFIVGSPLAVFVNFYFRESFIRSKLPTCGELCNIFHPSDFIAYRIEPLVKPFKYISNKRQEVQTSSTFRNLKVFAAVKYLLDKGAASLSNRMTSNFEKDKKKENKKKEVNFNKHLYKKTQV